MLFSWRNILKGISNRYLEIALAGKHRLLPWTCKVTHSLVKAWHSWLYFCIGLFPFASNLGSDSMLNSAQSHANYPRIVCLSWHVTHICNYRHGRLRLENHLSWKAVLKLSLEMVILYVSHTSSRQKEQRWEQSNHLDVNFYNALFTPPSGSKICVHLGFQEQHNLQRDHPL